MQLAFASADPSSRPTPRARGAHVSDAVEARLRARARGDAARIATQSAGEFWNALRAAAAHGADARDHGDLAAAGGLVDARRRRPRDAAARDRTAGATRPLDARRRPRPARRSRLRRDRRRRADRRSSALGAIAAVGGAVAGVIAVGARAPRRPRSAPPRRRRGAGPRPRRSRRRRRPRRPAPPGMIRIPGGKFFMGSDEHDAVDNEKPAHQVTLAPYCIDTIEVTAAHTRRAAIAARASAPARSNDVGGHRRRTSTKVYDPLCNARDPRRARQHPINCVAWELAEHVLQAASGGRLPTEAEWEFAARGPDGRKYPWGDEAPPPRLPQRVRHRVRRVGDDARRRSSRRRCTRTTTASRTPRRSARFPKGRSRYGVADVVGNVWEWVADWYAPYAKDERDATRRARARATERVVPRRRVERRAAVLGAPDVPLQGRSREAQLRHRLPLRALSVTLTSPP